MEVVRAFTTNSLHTEIVIRGTHDSPLFRASDIGEALEMNNIRTSTMHLNDSEKVIIRSETAGGTQSVTFLTEKGLYKVLFKSRKLIANKFQDWVCDVIRDLRLHGTYAMQQNMQNAFHVSLINEKALENQRILLSKFGSCGPCIYVIRVKSYENGGCVLKIGESRRGVEGRYTEHRKKYEESLLLDCFPVLRSKDFESFLLHHEQVRHHRVTDLPGHETEMELVKLGTGLTYAMLLNIIQNNLDSFNHYGAREIEALERENELLKSMIQSPLGSGIVMVPTSTSDDILREILNMQKLILEKMNNLERGHQKTVTNFNLPLATLGPRLQQIDPETMTLVKWYESVEDCLKQNGYNKLKRPSIAKAIEQNSIYRGFRWSFVDRNEDPNLLGNMVVTKETKSQNLGYVAKLDQAKSKILAVYLDRKIAAVTQGLSRSALEKPVKTGKIHRGHYYMLYQNVDPVLREAFEAAIGEELLLFKTKGVSQFDAENHLVRTYSSRDDCHCQFNIGDRTLNKAIATGMAYNGFVYKFAEPKLFIEC